MYTHTLGRKINNKHSNKRVFAENRRAPNKHFQTNFYGVQASDYRGCDLDVVMEERNNNMAEKKNQISLVDFVILQFFYAFQSVYESITSILKWNPKEKSDTPTTPPNSPINEKRHFIQLYKTEPKGKWEKPICYINVIEFDNSLQEEEIRKRKRSYDFPNRNNLLHYQRHQRTKSDNELERFYCSNLRY